MTRQEQLESQGWERRTTYDEPRLSEIAETYSEMGFEVHIEAFNPDEEPGCITCMKERPELYKTIYTRKVAG
jgi:hypothetical protein